MLPDTSIEYFCLECHFEPASAPPPVATTHRNEHPHPSSEDATCSSIRYRVQFSNNATGTPVFFVPDFKILGAAATAVCPSATPRPPSTSSGQFLLRLCGCADSTLIFVFQFRLRRHRLRRVDAAGERRGRRVAACADAPDQWAMSSPFSYERYASMRR